MSYLARVRELEAIRSPKAILNVTVVANVETKLHVRTSESKGKFECKDLREIAATTRIISLGAYKNHY